MEIPKHFLALFSGHRRVPPLPTLLIAAFVTALVAVPLTFRAVEAGGAEPAVGPAADAGLVMVDTARTDPSPLDGSIVGGNLLISAHHDEAVGVSFNLFAAGSDEVLVSTNDLTGPPFDLLPADRGGARPLDSTLLPDGRYELFLTVATPEGEQRTAVAFTVANP